MNLTDCHLDHIAIAVENLEQAVAVYENIGIEFSKEREIVESQKVKTAFGHVDQRAHIELLESTDPDGPIGKYIAKKGPGIHHLCFRVTDVASKQAELEESGMSFIYPSAVEGAGNCLVNFIHPKSTGGVLIEISQKR